MFELLVLLPFVSVRPVSARAECNGVDICRRRKAEEVLAAAAARAERAAAAAVAQAEAVAARAAQAQRLVGMQDR